MWKAKIYDNPAMMGKEVFIYREDGEKITFVSKDFTEVTVTRGGVIDRGLILNEEQLRALAQALGEVGLHPEKEYIEGKFEATVEHLSDLRKLLKL